jgi:hypothetical protein
MEGTLRRGPVRIKDSPYVPTHIPEVIEREFLVIADKAQQIVNPFEQAVFLLVHLPYLQPFEDCNKRTARVACNIPLLAGGVIPMSWLDVKHRDYIDAILAVYEKNNPSMLADMFVDAYIQSSERFQVLRGAMEPPPAVVTYREALRRTVRAVVMEGEVDFEEDVPAKDQASFCLYVERELEQLRRKNPAAMLRYRLEEGDVQAWIDRGREDESWNLRERMAG